MHGSEPIKVVPQSIRMLSAAASMLFRRFKEASLSPEVKSGRVGEEKRLTPAAPPFRIIPSTWRCRRKKLLSRPSPDSRRINTTATTFRHTLLLRVFASRPPTWKLPILRLNTRTMVAYAAKPLVGPFTTEEWESFLENDPPSDGVRLLLRKATSSASAHGLTYPDALDVALCFGWIDGQAGRHAADPDYTARAFTPRRARSRWSQVNQEHVERLVAAGRMRTGGLAEVERAKADGRWEAAYRMKTAEPDADFVAALNANVQAKTFWGTLGRTKRFPFLFQLMDAKRPETKARRMADFVERLARGETLR
ncbi:bacteriocin-protection, YdeI or OmpD-associated-domain-containing protein [Mycena epipterygia]|nr:bacteriocin-protection, YdeI or OmpD-associated-domain-containing protein [Mycena epipterygia]